VEQEPATRRPRKQRPNADPDVFPVVKDAPCGFEETCQGAGAEADFAPDRVVLDERLRQPARRACDRATATRLGHAHHLEPR